MSDGLQGWKALCSMLDTVMGHEHIRGARPDRGAATFAVAMDVGLGSAAKEKHGTCRGDVCLGCRLCSWFTMHQLQQIDVEGTADTGSFRGA